jgi:IS5 family transposase
VVRNARRRLRAEGQDAPGRVRALVDRLEQFAQRTTKVAEQCRQRIAGTTPDGATRVVSLHDPDARPIAKGRLGKPVEFGYKAQVTDNDDGIFVDYNLEQGNPADAPQLAPAVQRVIKRTGKKPRTVTADRSYGEQSVEDDLHGLGVRHVVIPRKGKPGKARQAAERRPAFRRTVKWRTGSEGRISTLKRGYGWDRTRLDGTEGARIWAGHGVLAHNLVKISALAA